MHPTIEAFFDETTFPITYVVYDKPGGNVIVINPVLSCDAMPAQTKPRGNHPLIQFIRAMSLTVDWILGTRSMPIIFRQRATSRIRSAVTIPNSEPIFVTIGSLRTL